MNRITSDYWEKESIAAGLCRAALGVSVPLYISEFQTLPWPHIDRRREECVDIIASEGDNILYRSKKPGGTAAAFNALAQALAILAFAPGGVDFMDMHFEAHHVTQG